MAASSNERSRKSEQLLFSGYDPKAGRVGGRPLGKKEKYLVATTAFLASGGDHYWKSGGIPDAVPERRVTLLQVLEEHLRGYPVLDRWEGVRRGGAGIWKNRTKTSGTLSRTTVDASSERYRGVSYLGGDNALAWNGQLESHHSYESGRGTLSAQLRTGFGQLRTRDERREGPGPRGSGTAIHVYTTSSGPVSGTSI